MAAFEGGTCVRGEREGGYARSRWEAGAPGAYAGGCSIRYTAGLARARAAARGSRGARLGRAALASTRLAQFFAAPLSAFAWDECTDPVGGANARWPVVAGGGVANQGSCAAIERG